MDFMNPIYFTMFSSYALLVLMYSYLYFQYRERSFLIWIFHWICSMIHFILSNEFSFFNLSIGLGVSYIILINFMIYLLYYAISLMIQSPAKKKNLYYFGIFTLGIVIFFIITGQTYIIFILTTLSIIIGVVYILSSILVDRNLTHVGGGKRFFTIGLFLYGLHMWDYPLFLEFRIPLEFGYSVASFLQFIIAFGILMVFFDRVRYNLKTQNDAYSIVANEMHDAVFIYKIKPIQEFIYISPSCEYIIGYKAEEIYKNPNIVRTHIIPEHWPLIRKLFAAPLNSISQIRFQLSRTDQTFSWIEIRGIILQENAKSVKSFYGLIRDITKDMFSQQNLAKQGEFESIGMLAGGFAHDFNNILTAIIGNISLSKTLIEIPLQNASSTSSIIEVRINDLQEIKSVIEDGEQASQRAKDLVQNLLTFSKGGAAKKEFQDIIPVIRNSIKLIQDSSVNQIELRFPADVWNLEFDKIQILQVFNNLLLNAKQAGKSEKTIIISLEAETCNSIQRALKDSNYKPLVVGNYEKNDFYTKISFINFDHPIPADVLSKLFTPHYTTKEKGTGLGLATSYGIVAKHDGFIEVQSDSETGTRFSVYLPMTHISNTPIQLFQEKMIDNRSISKDAPIIQSKSQYPKSKKIILCLDDEISIRKLAIRLFNQFDTELFCAATGEEAIALYKQALEKFGRIDYAILDLINVIGKGGRETLIELQKINPNFIAIAMSGYTEDTITHDFKSYGFHSFLKKPFMVEDIQKILNFK